jgi:hypothetical protein
MSRQLKPSADGVPELKPEQAIVGNVKPAADADRFAVSGAEKGDFLFRLNANTLSGKKGDGTGAPVTKGSLCLFRPLNREVSKLDAYLIRRTDGKAFGATCAVITRDRFGRFSTRRRAYVGSRLSRRSKALSISRST